MLYFYLLTIVQVVVESLPVSSSGHLLLLERAIYFFDKAFLSWQIYLSTIIGTSDVVDQEVIHLLHVPTAIIIILFFAPRWMPLCIHVWRYVRPISRVVFYTACADVITGIVFLCAKKLPLHMWPLPFGFACTASVLFALVWCRDNDRRPVTWRTMVWLGFVQGITVLPGVSRFGTVFAAARWCGVPSYKAFGIVWQLQLPLICAAAIKGIYDMREYHAAPLLLRPDALAIISGATIIGFLAFWLASRLAHAKKLWWFGWYMSGIIVLAWYV